MPLRDFALLFTICFVWGLNIVVSRAIVAESQPLFYAAVRFVLLAMILSPLIVTKPRPKQFWTLLAIGQCIGGLNFALSFLALKYGTASSFAVVSQLGLPATTLMSMIFLGERVGWIRGMGMALSLAGVLVIVVNPSGIALSLGVVFAVLMVVMGSGGAILMKRVEPMSVFDMQAWVAMTSWPPVAIMSAFLEHDQVSQAVAVGWPYVGAVLFSVFLVSMFGHGLFYSLLKRHEVTVLTPLTLMTPLWTIALSALWLGETLSARLLLGAGITLVGVAIIAFRPNLKAPEAVAQSRLTGE